MIRLDGAIGPILIQIKPNPSTDRIESQNRGWWCGIVASILLVLIAWPIILSGNDRGRGAADDLHYHWVAIEQFTEQLPSVDLSDYASATTPGYHLELAVVLRFVEWIGIDRDAGRIVVQLYASLWSVLLIGVLAGIAGNAFGRKGLVIALPLIASMYVLYPAIWLLPDNAGWMCVLVMLLLGLGYAPSTRILLTMGVMLGILVLIRQVHLWTASIIVVSAWIGHDDSVPSKLLGKDGLFSSLSDRTKRVMIALLATIPAILALLWFARLWGGLVPPRFQSMHQGPNLATPGFILLQLCVLSLFFVPVLWSRGLTMLKEHRGMILIAIVIGLVIGLVPMSFFDVESGRYSGWWNVVNKFPVIEGRSIVFVAGSVIGAVLCVVWGSFLEKRDLWVLGIGGLGFVTAMCMNHACWQRYHEPMLLMVGILVLCRSESLRAMPGRVLFGCGVLTLVFAAITTMSMLSSEPVGEKFDDGIEQMGNVEVVPAHDIILGA